MNGKQIREREKQSVTLVGLTLESQQSGYGDVSNQALEMEPTGGDSWMWAVGRGSAGDSDQTPEEATQQAAGPEVWSPMICELKTDISRVVR